MIQISPNFSKKIPLWFVLIAILFLILARDNLHQWDEACFLSEAAYGSNFGNPCFPSHQFRGNILILSGLVSIFGKGLFALYILDFTYALFVAAGVYLAYLSYTLLVGEKQAKAAAIILLFMPVMLYLGYKNLSESPGFLVATASIYLFIYGYKTKKNNRMYLFISGIFIFISGVIRTDAPVIILSFITAYFLLAESKKGYVEKAAIVAIAFFVIFGISLFIFRFNPFERYIRLERFLGIDGLGEDVFIVSSETSFTRTIETRIKNIPSFFFLYTLMAGGFLYFFVILSILSYKKRIFWFSLFWYIMATLPTFLVLSWSESRYFYVHAMPFALLSSIGFTNFKQLISRFHWKDYFSYLVLVLVLAGGLIFPRQMEVELDSAKIIKIIEQIDYRYNSTNIIVPDSYASFSFIKFVYPNRNIYTSEGKYNFTVIKRKIPLEYGIYNIDRFLELEGISLYLCRDRLIPPLFSGTLFSSRQKEKKPGTCQESWIWENEYIKLIPVIKDGPYLVFEIQKI